MSVRSELADAANDVEGVNVKPYYRQSTKPGDGWVSLASYDRDDTGFSFMDTWEVRIILHSDLRTAEEWVEDHGDSLIGALSPHLIIMSLALVTFVADAGNIPGLLITGVRPHPEGTP